MSTDGMVRGAGGWVEVYMASIEGSQWRGILTGSRDGNRWRKDDLAYHQQLSIQTNGRLRFGNIIGLFYGANAQGLCATSKGEIIERGWHVAGGLSAFDQAVNGLQGFFLNPNLAALRADFGGNVLEEVEMSAAPLLMGDRGGAELATAHGTQFCCGVSRFVHGYVFLRRGRLVHGSSHLLGSSQCTVMI
jgi:hypothetical protein